MVPALLPFSPPPRGLRRRRCLSCCSSGVRSPRPVPCSAAGRCRLLRRQRWPPRRHGGPRRSMKRRRSLIRRTRAAPRLGAAALCRCARSRTGRRCQPRMERETSVPQGCRPVPKEAEVDRLLKLVRAVAGEEHHRGVRFPTHPRRVHAQAAPRSSHHAQPSSPPQHPLSGPGRVRGRASRPGSAGLPPQTSGGRAAHGRQHGIPHRAATPGRRSRPPPPASR